MKNALISVFNKTGIENLAADLSDAGWVIFSTGGTAAYLSDKGIAVKDIADLTGFAEMLGGRVKTLHPHVFAPILARPGEMAAGPGSDFPLSHIDLLIVDFYPFEKASRDNNLSEEDKIEMIDIGGPAMVRAAAKNHLHTLVVVEAEDRDRIVREMVAGREIPVEERRRLAQKAFAVTSYYDSLVAAYLADGDPDVSQLTLAARCKQKLRYGENPHQAAALFQADPESAFMGMCQLQGKELSYNNILDIATVYEISNEFVGAEHFAVIVKHQNPCGAALARNQEDAWEKAWQGDPQAAFGGIAAFNKPLKGATAGKLRDVFLEVIVAPAFTPQAREILKGKKNLRLLEISAGYRDTWNLRSVPGGFLRQAVDSVSEPLFTLKSVRQPTEREWRDIRFGWRLVKYVKSNAIILVKKGRLVSVGAGQMSRIDAVNIALQKAGAETAGSVLLSDAFFPFSDAVTAAANQNVKVMVETGGSVRDQEVVEAAQKARISLVFSGVRHFRH